MQNVSVLGCKVDCEYIERKHGEKEMKDDSRNF